MPKDSLNADDQLFNKVVILSPLTVSPDLSVNETISQMHQARSSYALVVVQRRPVGIFTERDLVCVVAAEQPADELKISDVMTTNLATIAVNEFKTAVDLIGRMQQAQVRHLSVIDEDRQLVGIVTQSSTLQVLNSPEVQQAITLLQQEVTQLRFENQALLEAKNRELERSQTRLSSQPEHKQIEQQQTQSDLEEADHELEISHDELAKTNAALTVALQELQIAKQSVQLANTGLESQIERRSADLHQAERRWRSLLENVHLVVIGLDCNGKVNYANPFFLCLTGYSRDDVIGKSWFETFVLPEDSYHTYHYFQQLITQGEVPLRYQNAILTRSGAARTIDWNNAILRDRQNAIIGTMSIGEDVTERLEVDRIKGEFISVISHELRTPLTAIHGGLELLTGNLISSESDHGKQLLQLAADSAQQLVCLVNDILELERLESGKVLLQKDRVDTRSLTHKTIDTFQVAAREKGITLTVSDPGLSMVADGDRLMQVLTNLLDNAIKFSEDNSAIWLSVEPVAGDADDTAARALFKVRDQGRGIPSEHLAEIFGRFTQVNRSDSREKGGTGLGLAICQNIVEQHDGSIWVESELGEGSCFQFAIPLNDNLAT